MFSTKVLYRHWDFEVMCAAQVDDSGKVQRLRKACPNCGPGIFMATHFNRVYWYALERSAFLSDKHFFGNVWKLQLL